MLQLKTVHNSGQWDDTLWEQLLTFDTNRRNDCIAISIASGLLRYGINIDDIYPVISGFLEDKDTLAGENQCFDANCTRTGTAQFECLFTIAEIFNISFMIAHSTHVHCGVRIGRGPHAFTVIHFPGHFELLDTI